MYILDPKYLLLKLEIASDSLKCAAKLDVAFGFVLETVEDGSCRYYYIHEIITLFKRSKFSATEEDLTKIMNPVCFTDFVEWCTKD